MSSPRETPQNFDVWLDEQIANCYAMLEFSDNMVKGSPIHLKLLHRYRVLKFVQEHWDLYHKMGRHSKQDEGND